MDGGGAEGVEDADGFVKRKVPGLEGRDEQGRERWSRILVRKYSADRSPVRLYHTKFNLGVSMQNLDIKFEDLFAICPKCHGEGFVKKSPLPVDVEVAGTGGHSGPCAVCGGKGGELTESGMAVKRLMEKIGAGA
jgi:hypothetical protein